MKKIATIGFLIIIFLFGCEKQTGDPFTIKFYGDAFEDIGYSVVIASDGYVLAGQLERIKRIDNTIVDTTANKDMGVIKTDWAGNIKWQLKLGGNHDDYASSLYRLSDNSIMCVGTYTSAAPDILKEVFLVRLSADGQLIWQKTYGNTGNQTGKDIIETSFGFLIIGTTDIANPPVTSSSGNPEGKTDIFILKTDINGVLLDTLRRGYPGNESATAIKRDGSGGYMMLGTTELPATPVKKHDLFLIKLNSLGEVIQPRIFGTDDDEYSTDIEVVGNGYLVSGTVGAPGTEQQGYILKFKTDIYADPEFSSKFSVDDNSTAINTMCPFGQGNFAIAGSVKEGSETKMLILEMDAAGNLVPGSRMIKGSSGEQVVNDIVSGDDGFLIAVGKNRYDINSMISFLKFKF